MAKEVGWESGDRFQQRGAWIKDEQRHDDKSDVCLAHATTSINNNSTKKEKFKRTEDDDGTDTDLSTRGISFILLV